MLRCAQQKYSIWKSLNVIREIYFYFFLKKSNNKSLPVIAGVCKAKKSNWKNIHAHVIYDLISAGKMYVYMQALHLRMRQN